MSVNKHLPHVLVLPEDDANRQLATGFVLHPSVLTRRIQVLEEVGGWLEVLQTFSSDHVNGMERYPQRFVILLVDFDEDDSRLERIKNAIPGHLRERVFVLGTLSEPEDLKRANLGTYEKIGSAMASDCWDGTDEIWGHDLLRHNAGELDRLRQQVCKFLFPQD